MVSAAALTALGFPHMYVGGRGRSDATKKIKYVAMTISTADFSLLPQFLLQKGMWPPTASSILVETVKSVCRELGAGNTEKKRKKGNNLKVFSQEKLLYFICPDKMAFFVHT